ncbi:hypothetical protein ABGB07_02480 [Micromonosporaceae bacterium B7E4]
MNGVVGMHVRRRTRYPIARCWAALAAMTVLVMSGCDSGPEPTKTQEPRVTYGQPAADMCEGMKMAEVAAESGLKFRSSDDPTVGFDTRGSDVYLSCGVSAYDESDRFRTEIGKFEPRGTVSLRTHPTHEDAKRDHESKVFSLKTHERAGQFNASSQQISGWWDEGVYVQLMLPMDPKEYPSIENLDAAAVEVIYELRHGNLLVSTDLHARAPTPQVEQVLAFLREFVEAITKEAVSHLSRTGPS